MEVALERCREHGDLFAPVLEDPRPLAPAARKLEKLWKGRGPPGFPDGPLFSGSRRRLTLRESGRRGGGRLRLGLGLLLLQDSEAREDEEADADEQEREADGDAEHRDVLGEERGIERGRERRLGDPEVARAVRNRLRGLRVGHRVCRRCPCRRRRRARSSARSAAPRSGPSASTCSRAWPRGCGSACSSRSTSPRRPCRSCWPATVQLGSRRSSRPAFARLGLDRVGVMSGVPTICLARDVVANLARGR